MKTLKNPTVAIWRISRAFCVTLVHPGLNHQKRIDRHWSLKIGASMVPGGWCLVLVSALCLQARAQSYSVDWFKIAGGGGTSTNGEFSLSGTIGQPDAGGPMTNGQFSITGGFWVLPSVIQTAGSPILSIVRGTPGIAVVSWSPAASGFVLQETLSLSSGNWTNSPSGATNPATVPATAPVKFYRLFKP